MVNENQIPIQKPIEIVQELKVENETPSFEEFMKDYKVDENLNYDDLSGGDVGEVKGYGPCKVCKKPRDWIKMEMACPAVGCSTSNSNYRTRSEWFHRGCGGYAIVSNRAELKCSKCSMERHLSKWRFRCSQHDGTTDESVSYDSFNKALGWVLQNFDCGQIIRDLGIYMTNHDEGWN